MRIRFLSDQIYDQGSPGKGPRFAKGYVLDETGVKAALGLRSDPTPEWVQGFLHRWLQRGVAEEVSARAAVTQPAVLDLAGGAKDDPKKAASPEKAPVQALGTANRGEPTKGLDDGKQVEKTDYSRLSREELDALARKRKLDVSGAKNKADVIAALELANEGGE